MYLSTRFYCICLVYIQGFVRGDCISGATKAFMDSKMHRFCTRKIYNIQYNLCLKPNLRTVQQCYISTRHILSRQRTGTSNLKYIGWAHLGCGSNAFGANILVLQKHYMHNELQFTLLFIYINYSVDNMVHIGHNAIISSLFIQSHLIAFIKYFSACHGG